MATMCQNSTTWNILNRSSPSDMADQPLGARQNERWNLATLFLKGKHTLFKHGAAWNISHKKKTSIHVQVWREISLLELPSILSNSPVGLKNLNLSESERGHIMGQDSTFEDR